MPKYESVAQFTDADRKVLGEVMRDIAIGYPEFNPTQTVSRKRGAEEGIPDSVRALKAASLNREPFTHERVGLVLEAVKVQLAACVEQSDPAYWRALETPGVDPEVSARFGERRMGEVLALARGEQATRARAALDLVSSTWYILDPDRDDRDMP